LVFILLNEWLFFWRQLIKTVNVPEVSCYIRLLASARRMDLFKDSNKLDRVVHTCIPTSWEAEIWRITVLGQTWQKLARSHLNRKKLDIMVHSCSL
jgi:hypothetical protein